MKKKPSGKRPAKRPARKAAVRPATPTSAPSADLHVGRHLKLVARGSWEYAERVKASGVVVIVAFTPDGRLLLTEQFRVPVGCSMIELPAGLAGDIAGEEHEELSAAAVRELLEETGYRAARMDYLAKGPPSAGLSSEVVTFFQARDLTKETDGGGDASERIVVHAVPLASLPAFLAEKERAGLMVDPKVYAGLRLVGAP